MRHLVLIGLSYSGKSSVGSLVADRLGLPFVDTDTEVERRAGRPIHEIFERSGEAAFRALEREVVESVANGPDSVIATGGGGPMDETNRDKLWRDSLVVYLETAPTTLVQRLASAEDGARRPLLDGSEPLKRLQDLLDRRQEVYRQAHLTIRTDGRSPDQIADQVCEELQKRV